jgi:hypothetical protein
VRKKAYANAYYRNEQGEWFYIHNNEPVPGAGDHHRDNSRKVEMAAPELLVHQMLDTDDVAAYAGIERRSVSRELSRGRLPLPQARVGKSPLWARPIIEHWHANRPGRGAHLRNRGTAA